MRRAPALHTMFAMVEITAGPASSPATLGYTATYGITALRYAGTSIVGAMMGLIDPEQAKWDINPAPTRLTEVVDRLVEGDIVISLFPDESGRLRPGPEVKVDVLPEGTETLALAEEKPGNRLADLPRF